MSLNSGLFTSKSDEYETPQALFDAMNEEFHFDLDAAATPENAKCARFYTREDDALQQPWRGNVWCNPPYGRVIGKFIEKAYLSVVEGTTKKVVMLLPARTDTKYWHNYVMVGASEIRFIKGRLKFGGTTNSAPFPSCIVVFDRRFPPGLEVSSIDTEGRWLGS